MNNVKVVLLTNDRFGFLVSNGLNNITFDAYGWPAWMNVKREATKQERASILKEFGFKMMFDTLKTKDLANQ